jgi:hypothetical protein
LLIRHCLAPSLPSACVLCLSPIALLFLACKSPIGTEKYNLQGKKMSPAHHVQLRDTDGCGLVHMHTLLTTLPCRSRDSSSFCLKAHVVQPWTAMAMALHRGRCGPHCQRPALVPKYAAPSHWRMVLGRFLSGRLSLYPLRCFCCDHSKAAVSVCQQALLARLLTQTVCSALCNPFALSASSH